MTTAKLRPRGTEATLTVLADVSGVTLPKALANMIGERATLEAARSDALRAVEDASARFDAVRREAPGRDALAFVEHVNGGGKVADLDLGPDPVEAARLDLERARRVVAAASKSVDAMAAHIKAETRTPSFEGWLGKVWAATVAVQPKASDRWADVQKRQALADDVAALIGAFVTAAARDEGAPKHEMKALREALRERPAELPTLASVRKRRRVRFEETGLEKTRREQEAAKAAERELDRKTAKEAAKARIGAAQAMSETLTRSLPWMC